MNDGIFKSGLTKKSPDICRLTMAQLKFLQDDVPDLEEVCSVRVGILFSLIFKLSDRRLLGIKMESRRKD